MVHPKLDAAALLAAGALDVARAYAAAEPLPGGRGTVRRLSLAGRPFLLKRESRGGAAGGLLPHRYLRRGPFLHEWALSLWLDRRGLCPPLAARWLVPRGPLLEVYTLLEPVADAPSLADLVRDRSAEPGTFAEAGRAVGRLHAAGVLHGDLNAGNLLMAPSGALAIDLRHSFRLEVLPAGRRRENLDRLARSLVKLSGGELAGGRAPWRALARGYVEGVGGAQGWVGEWAEQAGRVGLVRRLGWKLRGV